MGRWRWRFAVVAWLAALAIGFGVLWRFASTAGAATRADVLWPAGSTLPRPVDRPRLLVFVHPYCPCSRATLAELARLVGRVRGRVSPTVVFSVPRGAPVRAEGTGLSVLARAVPDVTVVDDTGGAEARRFGAATSGATLLYDTAGRLRFSGGLTAVRGHEGDSLGQERIVAVLTSGRTDRADSPVFGCPLEKR